MDIRPLVPVVLRGFIQSLLVITLLYLGEANQAPLGSRIAVWYIPLTAVI